MFENINPDNVESFYAILAHVPAWDNSAPEHLAVLFPDEGHGFRKKANQIAAYEAIEAFLDKYVRNAPAAPAVSRNHDKLDLGGENGDQ